MENSVPKAQKPRFVKCPKCWNLLQEVDDVPVYRCGVCDTMLQAKHSKKRHDVESPPAPSGFGDHRDSENDAPNLTVEPSTPGLNSEENLESGGNRDDETKDCLGEKLGANSNLGKDESEMLSSEEKEEEFIEEDKRLVDGTKSNDGKSPNYEGSVSSLDERGEDDIGVPQFKEIPGGSEKISFSSSSTSSSHHEMEDENSLPPSQSQEKLKDVILIRNQPNMMPKGSEDEGSFNPEIPRPTQDIEDGKSFTSPQWNDQDSNEPGRAELLKMVDELRYQLIGKPVQDESDLYSTSSRLQLKGGRHARGRSLRRSMMKMQESEPEFSNHSLAEGLRSSRQNVPNCVHCHAFPPPPLGIFCANGLCTSCCRTYCNSSRSAMSASGDWQYHISPPNPPHHLRSNSSTSTEDSWFARSEQQQQQQQKVRKDHHITKRHCRPIFGGANLIICYRCHKLIQMPDDLLISRSRTNKLRCGACFKVLTFQIPEDASREEVAGNLFSYHSGGDPGSSSTRNNAVGVERDRRKKEAALHSLMGYSSARDIIFQPSDED